MGKVLEFQLEAVLGSWVNPREQIDLVCAYAADEVIDANRLTFGNYVEDKLPSGYVLVGKAQIKLELQASEDQVRQAAIDELRRRKSAVYADAEMEAKKIQEQIQSLLAIEHKPLQGSRAEAVVVDDHYVAEKADCKAAEHFAPPQDPDDDISF